MSSNALSNEATDVDLAAYEALAALGWKRGDTLLYQQSYALTEVEQKDFPGSKSIKPDFVLVDLQGMPVAVMENKLDDPQKALPKLRLKYSRVLRPHFLYACAADGKGGLRILFFDLSWRGEDAMEFREVDSFMSLDEMRIKIEQARQRQREQVMDVTQYKDIAGGFDPAAGKDRYYQLDCIRIMLELFLQGRLKILIHMATGLGKTRTMVAFVKLLLDHALAKRVLFVVDRRTLARQAINKGFKFLSPAYNCHWVTSGNWKSHKNKNIHAVVIDTLELLYDKIPSNFYDLVIVDECHRGITVKRDLVFDHFVCPRIGLTATPKIAVPAEGAKVDDEDLAINDTYRLFGCESGTADYEFGLDRGIEEGFLAPYRKEEHITALTKEAMEKGILYDHLLDPEAYARGERKRIELSEKQKIELEQLNRRVLSEEQAQRWAEIIREKTEYGEKVLLFAASQAHSLMLVRALNKVFNDPGESPRYAEAIISDNHDVNEALKEWFELPYANPRIVVSVDIMSTGVDIPCVRHIAFGALTKSVGKYIQMVGRGTRLDPKTGKFMFNVLDFVGLCARMKDNGRGSPQPNQKVVKPSEGSGKSGGGGGGGGGTVLDGILDNPDPKHLIQRVLVMDGKMKLVDNLPIEKARELFEVGVLSTSNPVIVALRSKIKANADYEPSEEEVEAIRQWAASPEIILNEEQLQRIYDYPAGSIWDFIAAILGGHRIPTARDRIERGFDSYLETYNFTDDQQKALQRIKEAFVANLSSQAEIGVEAIFSNPIYQRLIGDFEELNKLFDGDLRGVVERMKTAFTLAA